MQDKLNKQGDNIHPWHTPFPIWNQSIVPCPVLTVLPHLHTHFPGAGQVVWYSHLFQNFPQFIVIHSVKGFGIVNTAEIDVFLELSCFLHDPADVGNLIFGSSAFSKSYLDIWKFLVHVLLKPTLTNLISVILDTVLSSHSFFLILRQFGTKTLKIIRSLFLRPNLVLLITNLYYIIIFSILVPTQIFWFLFLFWFYYIHP